jgi:hypothetical protein
MSWAGHVARIKRGDAYTGFVKGNPEETIPLRSPRLRWEDNIKMDLQKVGCRGYGLDRPGSG